jgi:predicted transcriptional regulator
MLGREPVNRFMTEAVLSVDVSDPAGEILRLFAGYPVHHLPVVDKTRVVGMLSSADVLKLEHFIPTGTGRQDYLNRRANIATIMRHPAVTVLPTQSVEQAARLMVAHGIHGLPVVDRNENLLGIITTTDIIHAALFPERRDDVQGNGVLKDRPPRLGPGELERATHLAEASADMNDDNGSVARALLHMRSRVKSLEVVLLCADRYLRAGQDERLHAGLTKAIERARSSGDEPAPTLGL